MKRLHWLVIKSFLGPFILTFFIVMFVLLMQFLWRYIDELVGKGLDVKVIAELLLYTSASLVPMALPLAILMASLMTFGNMGEFYELSAMKSSGISLQRIMSPLVLIVVLLSIAAFFFSNNVMPVTNLKMRTLLWDVRQQRPELQIREGEFYNGVDNYSIRVGKKNPQTNILYDIKIYDHTRGRGNVSVIVADSGYMRMTTDNKNLIITLWHGRSYTEEEEDRRKRNRTYPQRMDKFREQRMVIGLSGFDLQRSDESLFKNSYQMMSLHQLNGVIDSLKRDISLREDQFRHNLIAANYFKIRDKTRKAYLDQPYIYDKGGSTPVTDIDSLFNTLQYYNRFETLETAINYARASKSYIESSLGNLYYKKRQLRRHEIEWHRKFTLSIGCLIFLFVGAPLGAIIRKGGLGMPTVISVLLFIFWYIISLTGEKMVRESIVTSFNGMWGSSVILLVIGVFLTYKAANDSALFNMDIYLEFLRKLFGIEQTTMLDKRFHLAGKFDFTEIDREELIGSLEKIINQSAACRKDIRRSMLFPGLFLSYIRNSHPESLKNIEPLFNKTFDILITSKWSRISYIKTKLSEYPYINSGEADTLTSATMKTIRIVLFPLVILFIISRVKLRHRLADIESVSRSIINGLNNQTLLAELEFQL